MISHGSLSQAIQSDPHFTTFGCHHASPSRIRLFDVWTRFNCDFGWLGLHILWWMIWGYLIFRSTIHLCHTGAYFIFDWDLHIFMKSHDPHHSRDVCRVDSLLLSYHDPPVESLLGHLVRLTLFSIYISSCFFFWEMSLWCLDPIQLWI